MRQLSKDILKKLLAGILFLALAMQLSSWYLYAHSHALDDGTIITHTHPYKRGADSNPFKNHEHTDFDQVFSDSLQFLVLAFTALFLFFQITKSLDKFRLEFSTTLEFIPFRLGRSPPSFR